MEETTTVIAYRSPWADQPAKDQRERRFRQLEALTCNDFEFPRSAMTEFDEEAINKLVQQNMLTFEQRDNQLYAVMTITFIELLLALMKQRQTQRTKQ